MKKIIKQTIEEDNKEEQTVIISSDKKTIEITLKNDLIEIQCFVIEEYGEKCLEFSTKIALNAAKNWLQAIRGHLLYSIK